MSTRPSFTASSFILNTFPLISDYFIFTILNIVRINFISSNHSNSFIFNLYQFFLNSSNFFLNLFLLIPHLCKPYHFYYFCERISIQMQLFSIQFISSYNSFHAHLEAVYLEQLYPFILTQSFS